MRITDPETGAEIVDTRSQDRGPISFIAGQGAVLPGLERRILGMKAGDSWTETLEPEEAFGFKTPDRVFRVPLPRHPSSDEVQHDKVPKVGSKVQLNDNSYGVVVLVDEAFIHVDCNHEYADRRLTMFIQLEEIEENPQHDWSGVQIQNLQPGDGKTFPQRGDQVSVHYVGMLATSGKVFDSSQKSEPIKFALGTGRVIRGWDDGIARLSLGERARLFISSEFAYGTAGAGNGLIPPNSNLVFDVELVAINGKTLAK
jgi:FK506-binding protein 1